MEKDRKRSFAIVKEDTRQQILCRSIRMSGYQAQLCSGLDEETVSGLDEGTIVITKAASSVEKERAARQKIKIIEYGAREDYLVQNAAITAENAIQVAMDELTVTLSGSNILVIGNGRIGKVLARMLRGIGADTWVSARRAEDIQAIKAAGHKTLETGKLGHDLGRFSIIFNTVPYMVLDEKQLRYIRKDAFICDLASIPGGVDFDAAKKKGIHTVHALALPGKLTCTSAANAIWETVQQILKEEETL